ncbi:hypothetical protein ATANTOWER_005509 [Ataeniobius toweri]|uniref:Uncharacterized protein n=1 Tax=Ataeniobius toweri TaxID=208326 RepID=A0ABU7CIT2_9TELE|nr:hypothetical protein [Ataeniobius toweri]
MWGRRCSGHFRIVSMRQLSKSHIWLQSQWVKPVLLLPLKPPWLSANRGESGSDAARSARKTRDWRAKFQSTSSWTKTTTRTETPTEPRWNNGDVKITHES